MKEPTWLDLYKHNGWQRWMNGNTHWRKIQAAAKLKEFEIHVADELIMQ